MLRPLRPPSYFFFAAFFFAPVFFRGRRFGAALGLLFLAFIPIVSSTKCTPYEPISAVHAIWHCKQRILSLWLRDLTGHHPSKLRLLAN